MKITKFNIHNTVHPVNPVSYIKPGLMTPDDKNNLESIKNISDKNISEIIIINEHTIPSTDEIRTRLQKQTEVIELFEYLTLALI